MIVCIWIHMLKEMSNNGMAIENHTSIHIEFTNILKEDKGLIRKDKVTTVLIGASKAEQILNNKEIIHKLYFTDKELEIIESVISSL